MKPRFTLWTILARALCVIMSIGCAGKGSDKDLAKGESKQTTESVTQQDPSKPAVTSVPGQNTTSEPVVSPIPQPGTTDSIHLADHPLIDASLQNRIRAILKIPKRTANSAPFPKIAAPLTPLNPASPTANLSFVPEDAIGAFVLHPRRILAHPVTIAIQKQVPHDFGDRLIQNNLSKSQKAILGGMEDLAPMLGLRSQNIDDFVILFDKGFVSDLMADDPNLPQFGVISRNSAPLEPEVAVAKLSEQISSGIKAVDFDGVAMIVPDQSDSPFAFAFPDRSTVIVGHVEFLRKMISAQHSTDSKSILKERLIQFENRMFVFAFHGGAIPRQLEKLISKIPAPVDQIVAPYLLGIQDVGWSADWDAPILGQTTTRFKSQLMADGVFAMIDQLFTSKKKLHRETLELLPKESNMVKLFPFFDEYSDSLKVVQSENTVTVTLSRLSNLETLAEPMRAVTDLWFSDNNRFESLYRLHQIGTSLGKYHGANGVFPALNGPGKKDAPHPGLSWRVYLLPFLGESTLFQEFKLNEPWDSEHNLTLIAKMPRAFGGRGDGKTSFHVLTGPGAAFQNDIGLNAEQITDGLPNVIAVVIAGDDVADFWTKPTGLEFDPDDPFACLGAIKELNVLMFDGIIHLRKDISSENFGHAVQIQDGHPFALP
jgi:hypothetical protein